MFTNDVQMLMMWKEFHMYNSNGCSHDKLSYLEWEDIFDGSFTSGIIVKKEIVFSHVDNVERSSNALIIWTFTNDFHILIMWQGFHFNQFVLCSRDLFTC